MSTRMAVTVGALLAAMVGLGGCSSDPPLDCVAVSAEIPPQAAKGDAIEVALTGVIPGCNAQRSETSPGPNTIELRLVAVDTTEKVLATGTADVRADGTAIVTLAVPVDAPDRASVELDDVSLGTLNITG